MKKKKGKTRIAIELKHELIHKLKFLIIRDLFVIIRVKNRKTRIAIESSHEIADSTELIFHKLFLIIRDLFVIIRVKNKKSTRIAIESSD